MKRLRRKAADAARWLLPQPIAGMPWPAYSGPPALTEPLVTAPFTAPTPADEARISEQTAALLAAALKGKR